MQLNLSGQHIEITSSLRDYVDNKFKKLSRHFDHATNIHIVLDVAKKRQRAEATVHVSGADLFASDVQDNMYTAIDHLVAKLDKQLLKHKNKLQDHHRSDGANMKYKAS